MGSVCAQSSSDLYGDAESGSSLGSGWARTFTVVPLVFALCAQGLFCWKMKLKVQSAMEQVIIEDVSVRVHL